jgi:poly(beta-D-mannuronate) lyase
MRLRPPWLAATILVLLAASCSLQPDAGDPPDPGPTGGGASPPGQPGSRPDPLPPAPPSPGGAPDPGPGGAPAPGVAPPPGSPPPVAPPGTAAPGAPTDPTPVPPGPGLPPLPPDEPLPPCKRTVQVGGGGLGAAVAAAAPGDCLVVADGNHGAPTITAKGTPDAPIVIRAANRLKAVFNSGSLQLSGAAHVVVEGFSFTGGGGIRVSNSKSCRLSRSRINLGGGHWVVVDGNSEGTRIDRNELGPKNSDGNMIGPTGLSTRTRIDRNYLHDVSAGGNGRETLRLGCCGAQFDAHDTFNVVEHNLLVNCSGEAEIITVKSSSNTIRYNTFRNSRGNVTLRAGKRSSVYGNFMFGNGIRLYDDDHKVFNNYVEGSPGPAIIVGSGQPPGNAQTRRAFIVHNTLIGTGVLFGHGRRPLGDLDTTFANNIIQAPGAAISYATPSVNPKYLGNIVFGGEVGLAAGPEAFRVADPLLAETGGARAIGPDSPAVNAATETFPFVTDDVNGQPREQPDVGADELSSAPGPRRPLTPADVGPDAP